MCAAKECKGVLLIADARAVDPGMVSTIQQDAAKIGITFTVRTINGAYPTIQTVAKNVPISERPGWGKDYADALTFFSPLFDGRTIIPTGNTNYSLLGITQSQCTTLKVVGRLHPVRREDRPRRPEHQLAARQVLGADRPGPHRRATRTLDKYLMTNVVPWVPWMWSKVTRITSNNVTHYQFDQFSTTPAYAHDLGEGLR